MKLLHAYSWMYRLWLRLSVATLVVFVTSARSPRVEVSEEVVRCTLADLDKTYSWSLVSGSFVADLYLKKITYVLEKFPYLDYTNLNLAFISH